MMSAANATDGVRLARVVQYPIKGFAGQDLPGATVQPGSGLANDRSLAISNGTRTLDPAEGWMPCESFVRLTRNTDLPRYRLRLDSDPDDTSKLTLRLSAPHGESVQVSLADPASLASANLTLRRWFPSGPLGAPRLVRAQQGLWDHQDAVLSIINLDTLTELSSAAGRRIDPLRFRGNLYLSGLPAWQEFSLVGRRIRLGEVELEVLRPIDRCRATSVDPTDASTNLNIPALLAAHYGHIYCGVYARVVSGGHSPSDIRWPTSARPRAPPRTPRRSALHPRSRTGQDPRPSIVGRRNPRASSASGCTTLSPGYAPPPRPDSTCACTPQTPTAPYGGATPSAVWTGSYSASASRTAGAAPGCRACYTVGPAATAQH